MHESGRPNDAGVHNTAMLVLVLQSYSEADRKLLRIGAFSSSFLTVALVEAIHAPSGVNELLFSSEKGVASGANFDV